jgi:hypothetical protein
MGTRTTAESQPVWYFDLAIDSLRELAEIAVGGLAIHVQRPTVALRQSNERVWFRGEKSTIRRRGPRTAAAIRRNLRSFYQLSPGWIITLVRFVAPFTSWGTPTAHSDLYHWQLALSLRISRSVIVQRNTPGGDCSEAEPRKVALSIIAITRRSVA